MLLSLFIRTSKTDNNFLPILPFDQDFSLVLENKQITLQIQWNLIWNKEKTKLKPLTTSSAP